MEKKVTFALDVERQKSRRVIRRTPRKSSNLLVRRVLRDHLQHNTGTPHKLLKRIICIYSLLAGLGLPCRTGSSLAREGRVTPQWQCRLPAAEAALAAGHRL